MIWDHLATNQHTNSLALHLWKFVIQFLGELVTFGSQIPDETSWNINETVTDSYDSSHISIGLLKSIHRSHYKSYTVSISKSYFSQQMSHLFGPFCSKKTVRFGAAPFLPVAGAARFVGAVAPGRPPSFPASRPGLSPLSLLLELEKGGGLFQSKISW